MTTRFFCEGVSARCKERDMYSAISRYLSRNDAGGVSTAFFRANELTGLVPYHHVYGIIIVPYIINSIVHSL